MVSNKGAGTIKEMTRRRERILWLAGFFKGATKHQEAEELITLLKEEFTEVQNARTE